jgi:kynurenine---oxoglutarate transaminase / cysteine-S-conjugate beta-lyase / glutamine---phenylpyruvate transaminase
MQSTPSQNIDMAGESVGATSPGKPTAQRVQDFSPSVFGEFTVLAQKHDAVNLGQGFPNFSAPDFVKDAACAAIQAELNQYARSAGHPRLVNALAQVYSSLFQRELNPMTEIVTTVGATEGIFATIQALIDPGDEVILIEPFYDSYPASVHMAGGVPVYVPLRPVPDAGGRVDSAQQWQLDMEELAAAFGPRTKLLLLNTPHNPVGKVFTRAELEEIATLVQQYDAYVLSDEVYEWMVYPGPIAANSEPAKPVQHARIATVPGMWDRTITLGSAGKTFSVTGWKVGWAIAPERLAHAIFMAHQWIPFAVPTPQQEAVGAALEQVAQRDYFTWLSSMYQDKRDRLLTVLRECGLRPVCPDGSYFILFDTSNLDVPVEAETPRDFSVARWFAAHVGVAAIPPSPFYSPPHRHLTDNLARFCFCKTDEMLDEAAHRLRKVFA